MSSSNVFNESLGELFQGFELGDRHASIADWKTRPSLEQQPALDLQRECQGTLTGQTRMRG
jgi:hypothetical protein